MTVLIATVVWCMLVKYFTNDSHSYWLLPPVTLLQIRDAVTNYKTRADNIMYCIRMIFFLPKITKKCTSNSLKLSKTCFSSSISFFYLLMSQETISVIIEQQLFSCPFSCLVLNIDLKHVGKNLVYICPLNWKVGVGLYYDKLFYDHQVVFHIYNVLI